MGAWILGNDIPFYRLRQTRKNELFFRLPNWLASGLHGVSFASLIRYLQRMHKWCYSRTEFVQAYREIPSKDFVYQPTLVNNCSNAHLLRLAENDYLIYLSEI